MLLSVRHAAAVLHGSKVATEDIGIVLRRLRVVA